MVRQRLDTEVVRRGLAETRSQAADLISRGRVLVAGVVATKAARLVSPAEPITIEGEKPKYVSRGGLKLECALRSFSIAPKERVCLDVGASTGGFTDCLLYHGAKKVYAVDVGRAQLHEKLRRDRRVVCLEMTDARKLDRKLIPEPCDIVTVDVSFISVRKVVPSLLKFASPYSIFVVLIKPQFEAEKNRVPKGGVIRDPLTHKAVLEKVVGAFEAEGLELVGIRYSPILGMAGNVEYLSAWKLQDR